MKSLFVLIVNFISCVLLLAGTDAGLIYHTRAYSRDLWKKSQSCKNIYDKKKERNAYKILFFLIVNGCPEATEPFNCPGTNTCISLQFLCDGIPGDCPNNYDEDTYLCNACK